MKTWDWDEITREQARAVIAEHGIVALEPGDALTCSDDPIEHVNELYFRLGDGRLLIRRDGEGCYAEMRDGYYCEQWGFPHDVISATASEAPQRFGVNEMRAPDGTVLARWFGERSWDWLGHVYPDEWELWRDGVKFAIYHRTAHGWTWLTF